MDEVFLKTEDNIKIGINHYNSVKKSVIIICPGWFMTKDSAAFKNMAKDFFRDFDVIVMDFRGHGKSGGVYTFMAKEKADIDAVVKYAAPCYEKIYLMGFSLGGGIVLNYAAEHSGITRVIAVSAPSDFDKIENRMYSPDAWIPTLFQKFEPLRWLTIRPGNPFLKKDKPVESVKNLKVPVLFIAGEKDPTVLSWHTKMLYDNAVCPKCYKLFNNTRHAEDLYHDFPKKFVGLCSDWLNG